MPIDRAEFLEWMHTLRDDLRAVTDRLDVLNGRTRENELAIAVLHDRASRAGMWSGGIGAVVVGAIEGVKWWIGKQP